MLMLLQLLIFGVDSNDNNNTSRVLCPIPDARETDFSIDEEIFDAKKPRITSRKTFCKNNFVKRENDEDEDDEGVSRNSGRCCPTRESAKSEQVMA